MKVSIIPQDNVIVVDGVACNPEDVVYPSNVRAIQWKNTEGSIEYENGTQEHLDASEFDSVIQPFVTIHSVTMQEAIFIPGMTARQEIAAKLAERGLTQLWQAYSAAAGILSLSILQGKSEQETYDENPGYKNAKDLITWVEAKMLEAGIEDI